jgi:hypothetical protein
MCTLRAAYTKIKPNAIKIICGRSAAKFVKSAYMISNSINLENHFGFENDCLLIQKPQKIAKESKRKCLPEK